MRGAFLSSGPALDSLSGPVAQLVEQGTFNPKVGGSIPPRPTEKAPARGLSRFRARQHESRGDNGKSTIEPSTPFPCTRERTSGEGKQRRPQRRAKDGGQLPVEVCARRANEPHVRARRYDGGKTKAEKDQAERRSPPTAPTRRPPIDALRVRHAAGPSRTTGRQSRATSIGAVFADRNPDRSPYWWLDWRVKTGARLMPNVPAPALHDLLDAVEAEVLSDDPGLGDCVPPRAASPWVHKDGVWWPKPEDVRRAASTVPLGARCVASTVARRLTIPS
jgi:hypothetical protein